MNISLQTAYSEDMFESGDGESVETQLEEHRQIMERAGYNLTGHTILTNQPDDDGNQYPGSYQVWLEAANDSWVYVTPDGNCLEQERPGEDPA